MLLALTTAHFHGEPATPAGNPGIARGSKPVAEVYTPARAVEWLIRRAVFPAEAQAVVAAFINEQNFCEALVIEVCARKPRW